MTDAPASFVATHAVPDVALPAWSQPDPQAPPAASLEPRLRVQVLEERDDGWASIRCSNGWPAWVDGRRLRDLRSLWAVPKDGLPAWTAPNPALAPTASLDPGLEVQLLEHRDDGWAHVRCSNDWTTWVDGRGLSAVATDDAEAGDAARGWPTDLAAAWVRHRALLDDLRGGRIDRAAFARQATSAGHVAHDAELLVLDATTARWWRYDGTQLRVAMIPVAATPSTPPPR